MTQPSSVETLPALVDGHVRLREVRVEDAAELHALFARPEVSAFLTPPPADEQAFAKWIELSRSRHVEGRAACYSVFAGDDRVAGLFMCVRTGQTTKDRAEIGFALSPHLWGTGVFSRAARIYIAFLFEHWQVPTLTGRTLSRNHRGLGAMRKLGATIVEEHVREGEHEFVWEIRRPA